MSGPRQAASDLWSGRAAAASAASVALMAALMAGCAGVSDRVILLPQPDGSPSAVELDAGGQHLRLDRPYAAAELRGGTLRATTTDAAAVAQTYGRLLAQQPAAPRRFTLPFESNGSRLAVGADAVIAEMRAALATLPAAEVVVIGHTDRVGSDEANDALSLARAEAVRDLLVQAGVDRSMISVTGRGKREPLVATADGVAEAANRRVEIKIR